MQNEQQAKEFDYQPQDFEQVRQLLKMLTGIRLADSKDSMVYSRLARRLRALRLKSVSEYLNYLKKNSQETENFINALTTNLTSFFREPHHFDILKTFLQNNPGEKRIWCAASSTGEEPYSIAITAIEAFNRFDIPIEIIASDIDSGVLKTAESGIYPLERLNNLHPDRLKTFFHRGVGKNAGKAKVIREVKNLVTFEKINLLDSQWPIKHTLDIIFCRNVMIYFDKETQLKVLHKMLKLLNINGLYFAGHSENFSRVSELIRPIGNTVYQPTGGKL